jgi:hypothetical protein
MVVDRIPDENHSKTFDRNRLIHIIHQVKEKSCAIDYLLCSGLGAGRPSPSPRGNALHYAWNFSLLFNL